ncbi:MAG: transposase [Roseiflexus sp.]
MRGREYCGYGAAKREKFFGWRLHLVCRPDGVPVRVRLLPAGFHDVTTGHDLAYGLPRAARLLGDKASNSAPDEASMWAETGVRLAPIRRTTMRPHAWFVDAIELHTYRHTIETVNSQLEKMGVERFYARTNAGFDLKVHAALIALVCTNMN